tara:strand:- start:258 stop:359 length:102 start_codon:yes stop_codon:yes gene_type:complete
MVGGVKATYYAVLLALNAARAVGVPKVRNDLKN